MDEILDLTLDTILETFNDYDNVESLITPWWKVVYTQIIPTGLFCTLVANKIEDTEKLTVNLHV